MTHQVFTARACLGCACLCDDITVTTSGARIVGLEGSCQSGSAWFGTGLAPARIRISGVDTALDAALDVAASLLSTARRPQVVLGADVSCEAMAEAVACADHAGARVDIPGDVAEDAFVIAAQERGLATATLGEVRARADLAVFWGTDPSVTCSRLLARIFDERTESDLPRRAIAVDVGDACGPADVEARVRISPTSESELLARLAAHVSNGAPAQADDVEPGLQELWARIERARYVVVVTGLGPGTPVGRLRGLLDLTRLLNVHRRGALLALRSGGNRVGAESVLTRQSGYPIAVDFASGVPRYRPLSAPAPRDVLFILGRAQSLPPAVLARCIDAQTIVIGPSASESAFADAAVVIDTGTLGIHSAGTALRLDDVPLRLEGVVPGPPDAADVCRQLRQRLEGRAS